MILSVYPVANLIMISESSNLLLQHSCSHIPSFWFIHLLLLTFNLWLLPCWSCSKDLTPHSNIRGPHLNSDFKVITHPHTQLYLPNLRNLLPHLFPCSNQFLLSTQYFKCENIKVGIPLFLLRWMGCWSRPNSHQPRKLQMRTLFSNKLDQLDYFARLNSRFLWQSTNTL